MHPCLQVGLWRARWFEEDCCICVFLIVWAAALIDSVRKVQEDDVVLVITNGCYLPQRECSFERIGAGYGRRRRRRSS